ncbi:MAG: sensor histidine kinase KdpD [Oscillospiraceae bacterium]|nr:sensor histidine kinase KdpD [Oscillospiraceae bacterium]
MQDKKEKLLVCLSPAPSNAAIIRAAARMVKPGETELVALFVETPAFSRMHAADRRRLQENMRAAEEHGAQIETVCGDDVAYQIAEYARLADIGRIVIGQSDFPGRKLFPKPGLTDTLVRLIPEAEVHVIPDGRRRAAYRRPEGESVSLRQVLIDLAVSLAVLTAATLLGALFDRLGFTSSNIMMAYLLGVLLISVATSHRVYSLAAAIASVFLFNYFFVQPRFTLNAYEVGYPVTFVVMFLTAWITGTLAIRLKSTAGQAARTAYRTKIISDTDQMLAKRKSREEILDICSEQVGKLLEQPFVILEVEDGVCGQARLSPRCGGYAREAEQETLDLVLRRNESAASAAWRYFPVQVQESVYAIVGIDVRAAPVEISEQGILLSVLGECALALENEKNAREKEEAAVQVENERLRSTLLRTVSHDLRTPLTSISGNAGNLLSRGESFDEETRRTLYADIYEDAQWLIGLVENLLASSRLEHDRARLKLGTELLEDLLAEAAAHARPTGDTHTVELRPVEELLLVKADAQLIVQVLVNLIDNALKYSPPGSTVRISAVREGEWARVSVADDGEGVLPEDKDKVFDMFYVGGGKPSDGRRSTGLGLALCRAIVEAHGGQIEVTDNRPHGAVFSFTLPLEEVPFYG